MKNTHKYHASLIVTLVLILGLTAGPVMAYDIEVPAYEFMDLEHPWATGAMTQLIDMGIVRGYAEEITADGETYTEYYIKPDRQVTRAEFSVMLARVLDLKEAEGGPRFADLGNTPWAVGYINALFDKGIIKGYGGGVFKPNAKISRGELVTMITLSLNNQAPAANPATFTDVKSEADHWSYRFIPKAVAMNIIKGYADGTFRPRAMATRAEVMAMLVNFLNNDLTAGASDEELIAVSTDYQRSIETILRSVPDTGNQESPYDWTAAYRFVTGAEKLSLDMAADAFNELALYGVRPTVEIIELGQGQVLSKSDRTAVVEQYVKVRIKLGPQDETVDGTQQVKLMKENGKWLIYSIPDSEEIL